MKFKQLVSLLFLCSIALSSIYSQVDFRSGSIITPNQDTIRGFIDYKSNSSLSNFCRFKTKQDSDVQEYTPSTISGFRFDGGKYYIAKKVERDTFFLEFLIQGEVDIFYLRIGNEDRYFLEKEKLDLIEIPYKESVKKQDGKHYLHTTKKHIGILNYYMKDAPRLKTRIDKFGKPNHDNLINLARNYHNMVCEDEICVVFEDKIPKVVLSPEFRMGLFHLNNSETFIDKNVIQYGLLLHIEMPRRYNKLYAEIGVQVAQVNLRNDQISLFKVPFHLGYQYPKGKIRPKLSYGLNYYYPGGFTIGFNGGTHIVLNKNLRLALLGEAEFDPRGGLFPRFRPLRYTSLQAGLVYTL